LHKKKMLDHSTIPKISQYIYIYIYIYIYGDILGIVE